MQRAHRKAVQCDQRSHWSKTYHELELHASATGHVSFACKHPNCRRRFSRHDTYQRHLRSHGQSAKRLSCSYCKKYRGSNGFQRKDHLTQHIRNYHHIGEDEVWRVSLDKSYDREWCPKAGCSEAKPLSVIWGNPAVFASSTDYVEHMRKVHNDSDFHCPQPGCDRINGKGYFRKPDLRAHVRKVHDTDGTLETDKQ
jgi:uncharacterized Zn-finger protein